jgi:hypothetical protein
MELTATMILAAISAAFAVFSGWRGAQPPNLAKGPRLVPWRPLMMAAALVAILALVHAANLVGIETGRGQR